MHPTTIVAYDNAQVPGFVFYLDFDARGVRVA
jgi:hypothetical protein